jgi:capsular exopolysaccharide synthesis family protein
LLTPDDEDGSRIVMLTSAQRGEGKSTVAANLAVTVAHSGRKVLIIDCDMRLPTLHKKFELPNKRGLTSVLTQEVEVDEATLYTAFPRLHVLTSGPLPPNPTELLGSPRMVELVRQLTEEYDYVILDTPAMLSVADAAVLTPLADTVIWVVTESQTRRGDVETVRRQLASMRAKSVEVVINRTSDTSDYAAYSPDGFALE